VAKKSFYFQDSIWNMIVDWSVEEGFETPNLFVQDHMTKAAVRHSDSKVVKNDVGTNNSAALSGVPH